MSSLESIEKVRADELTALVRENQGLRGLLLGTSQTGRCQGVIERYRGYILGQEMSVRDRSEAGNMARRLEKLRDTLLPWNISQLSPESVSGLGSQRLAVELGDPASEVGPVVQIELLTEEGPLIKDPYYYLKGSGLCILVALKEVSQTSDGQTRVDSDGVEIWLGKNGYCCGYGVKTLGHFTYRLNGPQQQFPLEREPEQTLVSQLKRGIAALRSIKLVQPDDLSLR